MDVRRWLVFYLALVLLVTAGYVGSGPAVAVTLGMAWTLGVVYGMVRRGNR